MGTSSDNVGRLKSVYRQWHESKGASVKAWLDIMADDVRCYSLAAGAPSAEFTAPISSKKDFERYFKGLLDDWEMIHHRPIRRGRRPRGRAGLGPPRRREALAPWRS